MSSYKPFGLKIMPGDLQDKKTPLPNLDDILVEYRTKVPIREQGKITEILRTSDFMVLKYEPPAAYGTYDGAKKMLDLFSSLFEEKGYKAKAFSLKSFFGIIK